MKRRLFLFVLLVCSFSLNVFAADNTDDTFGFQVELYDSKGDALEGSYPVLVNNTRENDIGSGDMVTLKADDVAYVCDLPDGCSYEVKEVDYDAKYYKPDGEGIQSGTYASGMISKAPFSNFYNSNGYVTSRPVMPETGGGGVGCVIVVGVLFIVLAVGLCFKRTRKTTICLLLVCTLPAVHARADNYFSPWFDAEFSCPGVGLGLRVLDDNINGKAVCNVSVGDIVAGAKVEPQESQQGDYTILLSDWVSDPRLAVDVRLQNTHSANFYSRMTTYGYVTRDDMKVPEILAFSDRSAYALYSTSGECEVRPCVDSSTMGRYGYYFDYFVQPMEWVDFCLDYSKGYVPDLSSLDDVGFDMELEWSCDIIQDHSFADAAYSAWGMSFKTFPDGHVRLESESGIALAYFTSCAAQNLTVHVVDDRSLMISKSVVDDVA